jgi:hypothetical protein
VQHTKTGKIIPNNHKHTIWLQNLPNGHKIYQQLQIQDPPKFTQIGVFGLKTNHLATLRESLFLPLTKRTKKIFLEFAFRNSTSDATFSSDGCDLVRVARLDIFNPEIPIWEKFERSCDGTCCYFLTCCGIFYGHLLYIFYVHLVYIFYGHLVYIFYGHLVYFGVISVMVCCTKKNLATLDLFFAEF